MKFVPMDRIDSLSALVQIMAWRRSGDKPIIWPNDGLVYRRIYVSLDLNVVTVYFAYFERLNLASVRKNTFWCSGGGDGEQ